jgi:hypothetical protein
LDGGRGTRHRGGRSAVELKVRNVDVVCEHVRGHGVDCLDGDVCVDWLSVVESDGLDDGHELPPDGGGVEASGCAVWVAELGAAYVPRELVDVGACGWEVVVDDELDVAELWHQSP